MTDYRKWDKIACAIDDDSDEEDDDDIPKRFVSQKYNDIRQDSKRSSLAQTRDDASEEAHPGFSQLKGHCVKLLAAKTNPER